MKGFFIGGNNNPDSYRFGLKFPYLRKSYQTKNVGTVLMEALPGTLLLAIAAMLFATIFVFCCGVLAAIKGTWLDTTAIFASITGISARHFLWRLSLPFIWNSVASFYWPEFNG